MLPLPSPKRLISNPPSLFLSKKISVVNKKHIAHAIYSLYSLYLPSRKSISSTRNISPCCLFWIHLLSLFVYSLSLFPLQSSNFQPNNYPQLCILQENLPCQQKNISCCKKMREKHVFISKSSIFDMYLFSKHTIPPL